MQRELCLRPFRAVWEAAVAVAELRAPRPWQRPSRLPKSLMSLALRLLAGNGDRGPRTVLERLAQVAHHRNQRVVSSRARVTSISRQRPLVVFSC
jgi:hypothetical protein